MLASAIEIPMPTVEVDGHLIEDAKVLVYYKVEKAEPDVGFFGGYEIYEIRSVTNRPITRILKAIEADKETRKKFDMDIDDILYDAVTY